MVQGSSGRAPRKSDPLVTAILALIALAAVAILVAPSDGSETGKSSGHPLLELQADPTLIQEYQPGETYHVRGNFPIDIPGCDGVMATCNLLLFEWDVVRITGPAQLQERFQGSSKRWYWPVEVICGSVYAQGRMTLIEDQPDPYTKGALFPEDDLSCPIPDFRVGETVELNFNFELRDAPAGNPLDIEGYGDPPVAMGGSDVIIVTGPTLGSDGHYYCQIDNDYIPLSWVPCEFAKT